MIRIMETSAERSLRPWVNGRVPSGYWDTRENRVAYIQWLGEQIGFVEIDDWYQIRARHFRDHGGGALLKFYKSSVLGAMQDFLPDYCWLPWLFGRTPSGFWAKSENRACYMRWLEQKLQIVRHQDWYQLDETVFRDSGGLGLFSNHYGGSMLSALRDYRPDVEWKPWLFRKVPNGFWESPENRQHYFGWLIRHLSIRQDAELTQLTRQVVRETHGDYLLNRYYRGSMSALESEFRTLLRSKR